MTEDPAGFDTRFPPPWLHGATWEERAANVIAGFAAMPDAASVLGYARLCPDIKHAPDHIKTMVRVAYNARVSELERHQAQRTKTAA